MEFQWMRMEFHLLSFGIGNNNIIFTVEWKEGLQKWNKFDCEWIELPSDDLFWDCCHLFLAVLSIELPNKALGFAIYVTKLSDMSKSTYVVHILIGWIIHGFSASLSLFFMVIQYYHVPWFELYSKYWKIQSILILVPSSIMSSYSCSSPGFFWSVQNRTSYHLRSVDDW